MATRKIGSCFLRTFFWRAYIKQGNKIRIVSFFFTSISLSSSLFPLLSVFFFLFSFIPVLPQSSSLFFDFVKSFPTLPLGQGGGGSPPRAEGREMARINIPACYVSTSFFPNSSLRCKRHRKSVSR